MNKYEKEFAMVQTEYKFDLPLLKELVERATPKKLIHCENSDTYECDDCGRKIGGEFNFCPHCGQALLKEGIK